MTLSARRTQQQRTEESSRRLAAAAIELIAEKGYAATTAVEIGERAGYSRSLVSVRFGGKDALISYAFQTHQDTRIKPTFSDDETGLNRAITRLSMVLRAFHAEPQAIRAMFIVNFEAVRGDEGLRKHVRQWLHHFREGLTEDILIGQSDGSIDSSLDAQEIAREINATGVGYAYAWLVDPEGFNFDIEVTNWLERIAAQLQAGVSSPVGGLANPNTVKNISQRV
ncbi:TetR/AcrR family transcriptional regulator [Rhodococcus opacus]|uniref:TetR/AcrR family transcriptional regulator n=1 Tax=Rhodococcus opacus TaxID=37919 RepID=UPI000FFC4ECC|nr:TetR/AcrR family transcriptional regulator [Rhodococcus opacus]